MAYIHQAEEPIPSSPRIFHTVLFFMMVLAFLLQTWNLVSHECPTCRETPCPEMSSLSEDEFRVKVEEELKVLEIKHLDEIKWLQDRVMKHSAARVLEEEKVQILLREVERLNNEKKGI